MMRTDEVVIEISTHYCYYCPEYFSILSEFLEHLDEHYYEAMKNDTTLPYQRITNDKAVKTSASERIPGIPLESWHGRIKEVVLADYSGENRIYAVRSNLSYRRRGVK